MLIGSLCPNYDSDKNLSSAAAEGRKVSIGGSRNPGAGLKSYVLMELETTILPCSVLRVACP